MPNYELLGSAIGYSLAVAFFLYSAYWALYTRHILRVRLYRNQAFGLGLVSLAFAFQITAKAGASGTYGIDFKADYMLDPTEPVGCGEYGELLAGTGQPNYFANYEGGCITYGVSTTNSSQTETAISSLHTISNYSYPLLSGDLYFRVAGVANSTQ